MALVILEGLDRVGKTSVADLFASRGYEVIHMSAPLPTQNPDIFLEEMLDVASQAAHSNICLDRSWYGELVWPKVYGRESLLTEEGIEIIREIEDSVGTTRILMYDPDNDAHWQRCVDNNEPVTKVQFVKARSLYSAMADKYGFERKTLKDFPDAVQPLPKNQHSKSKNDISTMGQSLNSTINSTPSTADNSLDRSGKSREQIKLERANIINEVLSKRIIKGKGELYDEVERSVRHFLNTELGKLLGTSVNDAPSLTGEEIELLKFFCRRLKDKET